MNYEAGSTSGDAARDAIKIAGDTLAAYAAAKELQRQRGRAAEGQRGRPPPLLRRGKAMSSDPPSKKGN